jgi:hypothetical protein
LQTPRPGKKSQSELCFSGGRASTHTDRKQGTGGETMIWLLVLILAILAIGGGIALSKFLFLLLVVALVLALVSAFNRSAV